MIHVHNVATAYPGLDFPGIGFYADRAMVCEGKLAIVPAGSISAIVEHNYYRNIGIGVEEILEVESDPTKGIYTALDTPEIRRTVLRLIDAGYKIQFFNTRTAETELISSLGLEWRKNVASTHPDLADIANDKACVRTLAAKLGYDGLFPSHRTIIAPAKDEILDVIEQLGGFGEVILKLSNSATAQGTIVPSCKADVEKWYGVYGGRIDQLVVEKFLNNHQSVTTAVRLIEGKPEDRWYSYQVMGFNTSTGEFSHLHSVVGEHTELTEEVKKEMRYKGGLLDSYFISQDLEVSGVFNWDCAKTSDEVFLLEANYRMGQSTYLREIQRQVEERRQSPVTCFWGKVMPKKARNFDELRRELGSALWDGDRSAGVIPMSTRCLFYGYCHMVGIGRNYAEAHLAWQDAEQALAH